MKTVEQMIEKACKHLPDGMEICIRMENGAAWVTLGVDGDGLIQLPDTADKTLPEQIQDALLVANGYRQ